MGNLEKLLPRDKRGNVTKGNIMDIDSRDSVFFTSKRLVLTIGLSDMVVIDTPDATLVRPKSQEIKVLVYFLGK